jgi:hypothetical protein
MATTAAAPQHFTLVFNVQALFPFHLVQNIDLQQQPSFI